MESYYRPEDLSKFGEIGKESKELSDKFFVVTAIRGGASLVHGIQMRNIAEKLFM